MNDNNKYLIKPASVCVTMTKQEVLPKWKETICKCMKIVPERKKYYEANLYFTGKPEIRRNWTLYEPVYSTTWLVTNTIGNRADITIITPTSENIRSISEFIIMGSVFSEFEK